MAKKKTIVTESELRSLVKECTLKIINETVEKSFTYRDLLNWMMHSDDVINKFREYGASIEDMSTCVRGWLESVDDVDAELEQLTRMSNSPEYQDMLTGELVNICGHSIDAGILEEAIIDDYLG